MEDQTGRPLVRATVEVAPLAGTPGSARAARTGLDGQFLVSGLSAGSYLVSVSRRGFAPVEYGQKAWGSAGLPLSLESKDEASIEIRMQHYGAIAGKIIDENGVGIPGHSVAVYRDARPLTLSAQAITDDRGMFRIFGLEPGLYLLRGLTHVYEDASYVPTYFKEALDADQAAPIAVELEADSGPNDIRARPGSLFRLSGYATVTTGAVNGASVTLLSDTISKTLITDEHGAFEFNELPPGRYELSATGSDWRNPRVPLAGYSSMNLDRTLTDQRLLLQALPQVTVSVTPFDSAPGDITKAQVLVRRSTAAGPGKAEELKETRFPLTFQPGYWEFALAPSAAIYAAAFTTADSETSTIRAEGWNRVLVKPASAVGVKFAVASPPASIQGIVKGAAGNGVADVPVFLEPTGLDPGLRLTELRSARSDAHGRFSFAGLAPGTYRLLGTFEFRNPTAANFTRAQAPRIALPAGGDVTQDLELYVIRER
jgi:hypothetical protein